MAGTGVSDPKYAACREADKYLLYQILSLMRCESHANETRRERPAQGSRNFLEHAFICDSFATPLGAHGLCPSVLAFFHGHLALAALILQTCLRIRNSDHRRVSRLRKLHFVRRTYRRAM